MSKRTTAIAIVALCALAAGAPATGTAARALPLPAAQERAEASYEAADAALQAGDVEAALQAFVELAEAYPPARFPGLVWRAAAGVRAGELELRLGRADAGAARFTAVLDGEPPSVWRSRARVGMARTLIWRGEWAAAMELLQAVVDATETGAADADPGAARSARSYLSLAHRLWVRPAAGQSPWRRAGGLSIGGTLDNPIGVAAAGAGIVIVDEGTDIVTVLPVDGPPLPVRLEHAGRPWWGPAGSAYIAAEGGVSAPTLQETHQFQLPQGARRRPVDKIRAGAHDGSGDWILLDGGLRQVMVFSAGGDYLRSFDLGPDGEPVDVATGPRGRIYVIEKKRREVLIFAPDGRRSGGFSYAAWRQPYAVAVDPVGNAYLLDRDTKEIYVFDADGEILWKLGPMLPGGVGLDDPRDLAVDDSGRLLIADRGLSAVIVVE